MYKHTWMKYVVYMCHKEWNEQVRLYGQGRRQILLFGVLRKCFGSVRKYAAAFTLGNTL